ncbi:hypothetical protein F4780DRAFT_791890 [Xylariomycetidae sp. FL0641]|nr:hypothetical protein F4780DRAFT_791890 [Xylariomycetidae sp. FL0641]
MAVEGPEYTAKQVAAHASADDAWMTIHGQVYDVTRYLHDHPGGLEVLLETAGTDASAPFDNAGHSEDASEIMAGYRVGSLKGYTAKAAPKAVRVSLAVSAPTPTPSTHVLGRAAGATAAAAAAVGLVYALSQRPGDLAAALLPASSGSSSSSIGGRPRFGFLEGALAASALFGLAGALASRRAVALLHDHPSFLHYAAHVPVSRTRHAPRADPLARADGWLQPARTQTLALARREAVAPDVWRLVFELPGRDAVLGLPTGQHVAVSGRVGGAVVTRSYTPVSNNADRGRLELLVKCYPAGQLTGGYLASLRVGDEVAFRGPRGPMRYRRGWARSIGMLAGGSGITPCWAVIRAVCADPRDTTRVRLVYANRRREDILLKEELDALARRHPRTLSVHYVLDQPPAAGGWTGGVGYVTKDVLAQHFPAAGEDGAKVMICGPPGMVGAAKNALGELGFEKPGAVAKMSDQVFCF